MKAPKFLNAFQIDKTVGCKSPQRKLAEVVFCINEPTVFVVPQAVGFELFLQVGLHAGDVVMYRRQNLIHLSEKELRSGPKGRMELGKGRRNRKSCWNTSKEDFQEGADHFITFSTLIN